MAHINNQATPVNTTVQPSTAGPLSARLRWGLGWTIVVATLGASVGLVSAADRDDEHDTGRTHSACVGVLGQMPDAVDQHIDACQAVRTAGAARKADDRSPSSGIQAWFEACISDVAGSADTVERWVERCADDAASHVGHRRQKVQSGGTADTLERQLLQPH
jgi:hypothetical protein